MVPCMRNVYQLYQRNATPSPSKCHFAKQEALFLNIVNFSLLFGYIRLYHFDSFLSLGRRDWKTQRLSLNKYQHTYVHMTMDSWNVGRCETNHSFFSTHFCEILSKNSVLTGFFQLIKVFGLVETFQNMFELEYPSCIFSWKMDL